MKEHETIRESVEELKKFEQSNPRIFQADGSVRFLARITWELSNEESYTEDDVYATWIRDGSGRISLEHPDGNEGWEVFWRFYADISHYYLYDISTNSLRILDNRHYIEITIEPELSVLELLALQDKKS